MANSGNSSFPRCLSRALFPRTARELLAVITVGILLMNSGLVAAPAVPSAKSQTEVVAQLGEHRFVHHGRFRSLYFLPSGEELLAVTEDEACVWDVRTGKQRVRFEYQPGEATSTMCGAMSRDGQTLLLAENGPLLYIFDTATGRRKAVLEGAKDRAPVVALSSDGRLAASRDGEKLILWDVVGAKELRRFTLGAVGAMAFSPDGRYLAIGTTTAERAIWIQDVSGQAAPKKVEGFTGWSRWFDYTPDGRMLAGPGASSSGSSYYELIQGWNTETGRVLFSIKGESNQGVFSPDGHLLAICALGEVTICDARTGEKRKTLSIGHDHVHAVAFSPDGKTLATGLDRRIQLWDTATWQEINPGNGHAEPVRTLAFAPDGKTLASGGLDGTLILWSWPEGREIKRAEKLGADWGVEKVAFSPDGRRIVISAWVNFSDTFSLYDVDRSAIGAHFGKGHPGRSAIFSADGKEILTGHRDGMIGVWDGESGSWQRELGRAAGDIYGLQPLATGDKVWWGSDHHELALRDLKTGEDENLLGSHSLHGNVGHAIPSDENWLLLGHVIWDPKKDEEIAPGQSSAAATSTDGRLLAYGVGEEIILREGLTQKEMYRASVGVGPIDALAFSPDGAVLAYSVNADVLLWDITGRLRERRLAEVALSPEAMDGLWKSLGDDDVMVAHRAAWGLSAGGQQAVQFLVAKLHPAVSLTEVELETLRARFSDPSYDIRDHAARELLDMGIVLRAEEREALRRPERILGAALGEPEFALGSSPTLAPLPERLRTSRAVMALEHSTAASAEVLLAKLSQGAPESPLTREAKSALGRVQARSKAQK